MKIAIVIDESRSGLIPSEESSREDHQKSITSEAVMEILSKDYQCINMVMDDNIIQNLKSEKVDMVFNLCNGINGFSKLAQLPAMLEFANIPYTGSAVLAHALAINKMYSCTIFKSNNIPTPDFMAIYNMDDLENVKINYPILVKPNDEGSSRGIHQDSLVFNKDDLYKKVKEGLEIYNPPIILNEFIQGREFSIGILGNGEDITILPIQEVDLSGLPDDLLKFYSFEIKSYYKAQTVYHIPAKITDEEKKSMEAVALRAYNSLMLKDYARVDIIMKDGIPYVLEINSLPGLMRNTSALYRMAEEIDLGYEGLILKIVDTARKRYSI